MKKLFNVSLLVLILLSIASCQKQKTSGFSKSDLIGTWAQSTAGISESFSLNEDGTGVQEGFLRNHNIKWDVRDDSLFMELYFQERFYKLEKYAIDSLNVEVEDNIKCRVLRLSRIEPVYWGISHLHLDEESMNDFRRWLKTSDGLAWLGDRRHRAGRQAWGEYSDDWLWSEQGQEWLWSEDGKAWQQTPDGKEFMRTEKREYIYKQVIK